VRCDAERNLQIDHIVPYARGGDNSLENLRLLCARHNRLAAEREYGKAHMEKYYRRE
jgi:5-methylcytosine-specific restriction endonuclease McrA